MAQISNSADGLWHTNAHEALTHLQARYASLSIYANQIMTQAKLSNLDVPCHVVDAYNRAVNDYYSFGRRVFGLLKQNKMEIEQIVYKSGKPSVDAKGNLYTLKIDSPLPPPRFVLTKTNCPGLTKISCFEVSSSGASSEVAEMGLAPIAAAALYSVGVFIVKSLVFGLVTIAILKGINLALRGPNYSPDQQVSAYKDCLDKVAEHVRKAYANTPVSERDKITAQMQISCRDLAKGSPGSVSLPAVLGGVAVVGLLAWAVTSKG